MPGCPRGAGANLWFGRIMSLLLKGNACHSSKPFFTPILVRVWKVKVPDVMNFTTQARGTQQTPVTGLGTPRFGHFEGGTSRRITPAGAVPALVLSSDYPVTIGLDGGRYYAASSQTGRREPIRRTRWKAICVRNTDEGG